MSEARFLTETSLELLARRLRILGHDVETVPGARLEALLEVARRSRRIALTTSSRHPRRFADVPAIVVPRDAAAAVRQLDSYEPAGPPFSRCASCNAMIEVRPSSEAIGHAPESIVLAFDRLARCPRCRKWYWHGSHVDRLRAWLEAALGRTIVPPASPTEPHEG